MIEINNKTKSKIDTRLVEKVAEKFFDKYKIKNKSVSIAFVGDTVMAKLNNQYRKKNKPTDILSFSGEGKDFGEIIIDYSQIKRQALKYSKTVKDELIFILVHGLLHLEGYEDESEKGRLKMEELGNAFVSWFKNKN